jgi:hypothetical protein
MIFFQSFFIYGTGCEDVMYFTSLLWQVIGVGKENIVRTHVLLGM